ncbi:MAG TPA: DUF6062 family protein [Anaerolineae bacterium]|nr:DUF6062 family protein [Anaerolineae bacterium]
MAKHTPYYELRDALNTSGCAICRLAHKAVARYLDSLVYENANDYRVRAEAKAARGFCNLHAWQIRDLHGAALDVAILSNDVLTEWEHALEDFTPQAGPSLLSRVRALLGLPGGQKDVTALITTLTPQRTCLACSVHEATEHAYIHELLTHITDPELKAAFVTAGGLCLPHFRQTLRYVATTAQAEAVIELQRQAMAPMLTELREFIRKHDYRFEIERTASEGESWLKALALVSGERKAR